MRFGFGRPKLTIADIEREAQAELDSAVKRAQPPTDAQRTWVLPPPEVPDLLPRRPARRAPAGRAPVPPAQVEEPVPPAQAEEPEQEQAQEQPPRRAPTKPKPKPRAAAGSAAAAGAGSPRKRAQPTKVSKSPTKKAATPRKSSGRAPGRS